MLIHDLINAAKQETQIKFDHTLIAFMLYFISDTVWAAVIGTVVYLLFLNLGFYEEGLKPLPEQMRSTGRRVKSWTPSGSRTAFPPMRSACGRAWPAAR